MTVFMSTRTNYEFGRYEAHSKMSWIVATVGALSIGMGVYGACDSYLEGKFNSCSLAPVPVLLALFCKNGRKNVGRLNRECFYGTLFSFTGVFGDTSRYGEK